MSKFIKVVDNPVVSASIPTISAGGIRVFQVADAANSVPTALLPTASSLLIQRIIIPFDNSLGSSSMAVFMNGFFHFNMKIS